MQMQRHATPSFHWRKFDYHALTQGSVVFLRLKSRLPSWIRSRHPNSITLPPVSASGDQHRSMLSAVGSRFQQFTKTPLWISFSADFACMHMQGIFDSKSWSGYATSSYLPDCSADSAMLLTVRMHICPKLSSGIWDFREQNICKS